MNITQSHSKFELKISGAALKEAIRERIAREESRFVDSEDPVEHGEHVSSADRILQLKLIADNLTDDTSHVVTLADLNELTLAQRPIVYPMYKEIMGMLASAGVNVGAQK